MNMSVGGGIFSDLPIEEKENDYVWHVSYLHTKIRSPTGSAALDFEDIRRASHSLTESQNERNKTILSTHS